MGSRYFQRPENAISKADEFIKVNNFVVGHLKNMALAKKSDKRPKCPSSRSNVKVGKPSRALDTLYDVIKSKKRNHTYR